MFPSRPRLGSHVHARRHLTEGGRVVVLFDTVALRNHPIAERAWRVIAAMDGTRDLEGIVARVIADGGQAELEEVRAFVEELSREDLVLDGLEVHEPSGSSLPPIDPARPLEQLPDFALACDGRGSCCRFYPTIAFAPLEAARARSARPDVLDAGHVEGRAFMPLRGLDASLLAVNLRRGRCAYLEGDGRCGIQRATDAAQKPLGCRTYPARFVDDGATIRVTPWFECGCVAASAVEARPGAEPLTPARTRSELDGAIHVERLPAEVLVAAGRTATPAELATWSRAVTAACGPERDGVLAFTGLARALAEHGLDVDRSIAALDGGPRPTAEEVLPYLVAMRERAQILADEAFRAEDDLARSAATALVAACEIAEAAPEELLGPAPRVAAVEAAYLRSLVFGHQLVARAGQRNMAELAFERGVRCVAARAMAVVSALGGLEDPAFAWPLSLVEALMRGYGLSAYARDVKAG